MGLVTTLEYAEMANRVYGINAGDNYLVPAFETALFEEGLAFGSTATHFKGCVYVSDGLQEVVVAFQGTIPTTAGDLYSDVQVLVGMLPQYCNAAMRLFERTVEVFPRHTVSLVGHSLGGGLAQIIGHWTRAPFVTFNAPGMWGDIQKSKILAMFPFDMIRSLRGTFNRSPLAKQMSSTGRNFRNVLDPVSAYGMHYGPVTRFWGIGVHSMDDILGRVKKSRWADVNPLDPMYKEWGEL
jgi:hypothetical protein